MSLTFFKIWMVLLAALDVMLLIQIFARIGLFVAGKTGDVDWTSYNRVMLSLLAVTFFPVTAVVIYLRQ